MDSRILCHDYCRIGLCFDLWYLDDPTYYGYSAYTIVLYITYTNLIQSTRCKFARYAALIRPREWIA